MKKIISILCLFVIASALRAQEFQVGELYYRVTSNSTPYTVEVAKLSKKSRVTTLDIPEKVDYNGTTYTVTSIGDECFKKCKSLRAVTIPNSVNTIGNNAFELCEFLNTINLSKSIINIGNNAFYGCASLVTINIPNSVSYIGNKAFSWCMFAKTINYQGTKEQWQQITKAEDWDYASNFAISYQPVLSSEQVSSSHTLQSNAPILKNEQSTHDTPVAKPVVSVSEVDKNIPQNHQNNSNTFVVIIANENYEQVANVPYAINDGQVFQQYCERTLGIPHQNIKTYIDATYNHIRAAQSWLQKICEVFEDEQIIFYYAGHGIPDESSHTAYLLPVDGIGTDISTGYKLDDLYSALGNIPAKNVIVFMDACFSGSKREEGMLASARGVAIKARSGMPQGNMVVFSAAQGDETAYPNNEEKHGMFTYYLLKKLQETQGDVSLQELREYITRNVSQQSILLNGKSQTPSVTSSPSLGDSWKTWTLR